MEIKYTKGKKSKKDRVLWVKTEDWEKLTYKDLFDFIGFFADNEETNYPQPRYAGKEYLRKAINQVITEGTKWNKNCLN